MESSYERKKGLEAFTRKVEERICELPDEGMEEMEARITACHEHGFWQPALKKPWRRKSS